MVHPALASITKEQLDVFRWRDGETHAKYLQRVTGMDRDAAEECARDCAESCRDIAASGMRSLRPRSELDAVIDDAMREDLNFSRRRRGLPPATE